MNLRMVSLFAGIGGFDLAAETTGAIDVVGQVEIADYPTRVLERHWPDVPRIRDVHDFDGTEFGPIDILTGGYPCQPFSVAGSREGERDPRHLWPEVARIIRSTRPRWVVLENVVGHLSVGFGRVLGDLAESGYDAEWDCIPASAVGAPHRRDRVWIVAYPQKQPRPSGQDLVDGRPRPIPQPRDSGPKSIPRRAWRLGEPPVLRGADGLPGGLDRHRARHAAIGNAVVPQVAAGIFARIVEAERSRS